MDWFQENMDTTLKILPPSVFDHALLSMAGLENVTMKFMSEDVVWISLFKSSILILEKERIQNLMLSRL